MTFILGPGGSRLSYGYLGLWNRVIDLYVSSPEVIAENTSVLGQSKLGTFKLGVDFVFAKLEVGTE